MSAIVEKQPSILRINSGGTKMLDLLIRGGEVVTPQGVGKWSVGVQGEKIAYVGTDDHAPQAGRTIDAGGKIVVPGGIEPHAHLVYLRSY
jgi:dihydroorotase-like cyclic amidohydrolase